MKTNLDRHGGLQIRDVLHSKTKRKAYSKLSCYVSSSAAAAAVAADDDYDKD